jgi:hypothetical protein
MGRPLSVFRDTFHIDRGGYPLYVSELELHRLRKMRRRARVQRNDASAMRERAWLMRICWLLRLLAERT